MAARCNPQGLHEIADPARPGVRFVSRRPGPRYLLVPLLQEHGLPGSASQG